MSEVVMLDGTEPREILQTAIDKGVPAIMSYSSKGKWHVAKVVLTDLRADRVSAASTRSHDKQHPINIQEGQPVGMSFKYEYGKYVFDTTVLALEPPRDGNSGGTVALALPGQIEVVQRRSYFRVEVPSPLKVNVTFWHRKSSPHGENQLQHIQGEGSHYCQGRLIDISAGGAQIRIDNEPSASHGRFKKGQFIGVRFTPMPYETPLLLNAQIRNVLPTADGNSSYLGLQLVGLEASPEGRQVLTRLVGIVERYYRMNQSSSKRQDAGHVQSRV